MKKFLMDENGQGMVEYGLIIALIAIVVIGALALLGPKVKTIFEGVNGELDTAITNGGLSNTTNNPNGG